MKKKKPEGEDEVKDRSLQESVDQTQFSEFPLPPSLQVVRGNNPPPPPPPTFGGDLIPGQGGSMLFGPGNPSFDRQFRGDPPSLLPNFGGHVPGARFDPYGPGISGPGGDPDPDNFRMPGPPLRPSQPPPPGSLGGWGDTSRFL